MRALGGEVDLCWQVFLLPSTKAPASWLHQNCCSEKNGYFLHKEFFFFTLGLNVSLFLYTGNFLSLSIFATRLSGLGSRLNPRCFNNFIYCLILFHFSTPSMCRNGQVKIPVPCISSNCIRKAYLPTGSTAKIPTYRRP